MDFDDEPGEFDLDDMLADEEMMYGGPPSDDEQPTAAVKTVSKQQPQQQQQQQHHHAPMQQQQSAVLNSRRVADAAFNDEDDDIIVGVNPAADEAARTAKRQKVNTKDSAPVPSRPAPTAQRKPAPVVPKAAPKRKTVHSLPPPNTPCVTMTRANGERVYIEKASPKKRTVVGPSDMRLQMIGSLLPVPVPEMNENILSNRALAAVEEAEAIEAAAAAAATLGATGQHSRKGAAKQGALWVDKYSPTRFIELLSDEQTNRSVLRWLKSWDDVVFGGHVAANGMVKSGGGGSGSGGLSSGAGSSGPGLFGPPKSTAKAFVPTAQQPYDRNAKKKGNWNKDGPEELKKVILLCGPPGLGKTTLAHILASHAGYKPVEINASDDRSATALATKVLNATQMQSMYGDRRPNCLILDEIDGTMGSSGAGDKGAMTALVKIITGEGGGKQAKKDGGASALPGGADTSGKQAGTGLQRPVICICNNPYAPALRPLRAIADIFTFRKGSGSNARLVTRLDEICKSEKVRVDSGALNALCCLADNDIRSCLNTLQFASAKGRTNGGGGGGGQERTGGTAHTSRITQADVSEAILGHKDIAHNLFDTLQAILFKGAGNGRSKSGSGGGGLASASLRSERLRGLHSRMHETAGGGKQGGGQGARTQRRPSGLSHPKDRFSTLWDVVGSNNEQDKVAEGVYENLLSAGNEYVDPLFDHTAEALDWLSTADMASSFVHKHQAWSVMPMLNLAPIAVHCACASDVPSVRAGGAGAGLQFPRLFGSLRGRRDVQEGLFRTFLEGAPPRAQVFLTTTTLATDFLPSYLDIITPPGSTLRPTASLSVLTAQEKSIVSSTVGAMVSYGVKYVRKGNLDAIGTGGYFVMEPDIKEAVLFDGQAMTGGGGDRGQGQYGNSKYGSKAGGASPLKTSGGGGAVGGLGSNVYVPGAVSGVDDLVLRRSRGGGGVAGLDLNSEVYGLSHGVVKIVNYEIEMELVRHLGGGSKDNGEGGGGGGAAEYHHMAQSDRAALDARRQQSEDAEVAKARSAQDDVLAEQLQDRLKKNTANAENRRRAAAIIQEEFAAGTDDVGCEGDGLTLTPLPGSGSAGSRSGLVGYKYQEGFTQAVRRPVYMKDLLR